MDRLRWLPRAGALALGIALAAPVQALSVSPTMVEMDGERTKRAKLRITAPGNAALVLDLSVLERFADGAPQPAEAHAFELRPPQLFVPAGGSADVSLRWTGAAPGAGSRSFYLVAEQLPVAMDTGPSHNRVHMLARVHVPVHVGSAGTADLRVAQSDPGRVMVSNHGTRYARFAALELEVARPDGGIRRIEGIEIARLVESDALLPGERAEVDASALGLGEGERAVALAVRR